MAPAPRSAPSSFRQSQSWLVVVAGLAGYVGLVFALTRFRVSLDLPLSWWALLAAPPILYGLLIVLCLRRVTPGGLIGGTLLLWAVHILLGTLTPLLAAIFDPLNRGRMLLLAFPPPPLPQLLWVPLLLVPLRSVLAPGSPVRRSDRPAGVELRRASGSAGRLAAPVPPIAPTPEAVSPIAAEPGWAQSRPAWPPAAEEATPAPGPETAEVEVDPEVERAALEAAREWEARMSSPQPPAMEIPEDAVVRIPFARIAGQFSTDTFLLPLDRVASSLLEPDYVVVPARLVLPQLGEGLVSVPWEAVAEQFPGDVLAITNDEVKNGLRDGRLVLPLDEVVRQLPRELFATAGPGPDVRALESFPAPFQPFMPEPETHAPPPGEPGPVPADVSPAQAHVAVTEPAVPEPAEAARDAVLEPPRPEHIAPPVLDEGTDVVRISFDRLAAQLPSDSFLLPLDRVSANLIEPGQLRIPRSLVLPQLGEGEVRVPWDAVAGQFPRHLLAVSEDELARQLPEGLLLPLEEVIRQLPPETFVATGPGPDVRDLESFPAPFQPMLPETRALAESPEVGAEVDGAAVEGKAPVATEPALAEASEAAEPEILAEPEAMPVDAEAEPVTAVEPVIEIQEEEGEIPALILGPESLEPPRFDLEPTPAPEDTAKVLAYEPDEEPAPVLEIQDIEPEPALMESLRAELAAGAPPAATEPPRVEPDAVPEVAARVAAETPELRPEALGAARRIAALMAPLTSLGVEARLVNGVTVFTLSSPGVPDDLAAAARVMLPVLADGRAPWPVDQLTLRGRGAALVFTPLGVPGARGPVLVAAVAQSGSLALLEILCRRAAAAFTDAGGPGSPSGAAGNGGGRPELVDVEPPARVQQVAATLGALGPVTASALRDATGARALYLFLPSGTDARELGGFALEVARAMAQTASEGAVFQVAVVRSGQRCLVIRPDVGSGGRSRTVVAAGETAKPGLAFRQVERAVTALAVV